MSFPKAGKRFPVPRHRWDSVDDVMEGGFAAAVGAALRRDLGASRSAVKTAARWAGADERSAKNWLAGRYGPRAEHLVRLMRHSDAVFALVLARAGRREAIVSLRLGAVRQPLAELLAAIDALGPEA